MASSEKNRIDQDIRSQNFAGIYLLYGEEAYLKEFYSNRLIRALIPEDNTINLNIWKETVPEVGELMEQALTLPFFAEHRLIVVHESGWFKGIAGKEFAERVHELPQETVLLFIEDAVDERGKLFKTVQSSGVVMKFDRLKEKDLRKWVLSRLSREGHTIIQNSAMQLFFERTGDDMQLISNELDKLLGYTYGRNTVLTEDIRTITSVQLDDQIFQMMDLIASRKRKNVLRMYRDLLLLKVRTGTILWRLSAHFMRLLQIRELREQGLDAQTISEKLGMHIYAVRKSIGQCSQFTPEELTGNLKRLVQADEDIKFGRMRNDAMALEQAILWITRMPETERKQ